MAHEGIATTSQHDILETVRSPSPVAPPPVAATPGPRATALQKLYTDATSHVLKTCNFANFASCFPTPAREQTSSLKDLHEQFTERLGASLRLNFDQILLDRNVVHSLNDLDRLIEDAKRRRSTAQAKGDARHAHSPVPPHTLPAQQLYLSHLAPSLSQQSQALNERQETLSAENTEMLKRVMDQRRQIKTLLSGLEDAVGDLERTAGTLRPEQVDDLQNENRMLDESMTMN